MQLLYVKSTLLFVFIYYIIGYRRKVVKGNLNLVFPEKSIAEIKQIEKQFYKHLCDLVFETIKSLTISEEELKKRFVYENMEVLNTYFDNKRSTLVLCGHYGNWEWSNIAPAFTKAEPFGVYKPIRNKHLDALVKKIRGRFGAKIISNKQIVSTLFRSSKRNEYSMTLLVADQTPKMDNFKHRDSFMGINVPVFTGTEELAKKLDFNTVYLKVIKVRRGYYKAEFVPLAEDPKQFEDFQITRLFLDEVEKQIYEDPQFYLWSHKRWKHRE
jgi:KDO2-lipid IV(A) lauroyltransferase